MRLVLVLVLMLVLGAFARGGHGRGGQRRKGVVEGAEVREGLCVCDILSCL